MSVTDRFIQIFNSKYVVCGVLTAVALVSASSGQAESTMSAKSSMVLPVLGGDGNAPTMDELRAHAATITDILETASERVELLATTDADAPALIDAIRQELSLSRRWNRHLGTILLDVAEARRALSKRERDAAKEITRLTAAAEEARLELLVLKEVLKERPDEAVQSQDAWSDGRLNPREREQDIDRHMASNFSTEDGPHGGPADVEIGAIRDTRAMLASVQAAEESLVRDVDAVRGKIIEALETLATVRGDLPFGGGDAGDALSSDDITGWAASIATKLNRDSRHEVD